MGRSLSNHCAKHGEGVIKARPEGVHNFADLKGRLANVVVFLGRCAELLSNGDFQIVENIVADEGVHAQRVEAPARSTIAKARTQVCRSRHYQWLPNQRRQLVTAIYRRSMYGLSASLRLQNSWKRPTTTCGRVSCAS